MNNIKKIIGERIKKLRIEKKLTQDALAEMASLDQRTISHIENGHSLSMSTLESLVKALNIGTVEFFELNIIDKTDKEIIKEITKILPTLPSEDLRTYYRILKSLN